MYRAVTKAEQLDILSDSQIPSDTLHLALDYIAESISNPSQKVSSIEHFGGSMATVPKAIASGLIGRRFLEGQEIDVRSVPTSTCLFYH